MWKTMASAGCRPSIMTSFSPTICAFSDIPPEAIYFRTVPTFEVDAPALSWLTTSLFICAGGRTRDGVMLDFYQVG